jgi:hypothetical protein
MFIKNKLTVEAILASHIRKLGIESVRLCDFTILNSVYEEALRKSVIRAKQEEPEDIAYTIMSLAENGELFEKTYTVYNSRRICVLTLKSRKNKDF